MALLVIQCSSKRIGLWHKNFRYYGYFLSLFFFK